MVQGLIELLNIELSGTEAVASNYFADASDESSDTESESQHTEPFKEVNPTMKVGNRFVLDEDSGLNF